MTFLRVTAAARKKEAVIVGFALETEDLVKNAKSKLAKKISTLSSRTAHLKQALAFGVETNRVTLITRDGETEEIPLMQKTEVAELILDKIETAAEWTHWISSVSISSSAASSANRNCFLDSMSVEDALRTLGAAGDSPAAQDEPP